MWRRSWFLENFHAGNIYLLSIPLYLKFDALYAYYFKWPRKLVMGSQYKNRFQEKTWN